MKKKAEQNILSRNSLETLTSSQLIDLADEYGVDIPDNLNRQFIIAELIDVAKEIADNFNYKETILETDNVAFCATELPESYNETKIDLVLRNPVSLFVYWDFSEVQLKQMNNSRSDVFLKVLFFDELEDEKPSDSFAIQIDFQDRQQYILIPGGKKYVRVDLIKAQGGTKDATLAVSTKVKIPELSDEFRKFQPGEELKTKPILELSGIKTMLKKHYNNYRQAFN